MNGDWQNLVIVDNWSALFTTSGTLHVFHSKDYGIIIMLSAVTWTKMRIAIKERLVHNHMLVYGPFTDAQVAFKLRDAFKAAQDCRHGLALCWQVKPGHSVRAGFWCNLWTSQLIATFIRASSLTRTTQQSKTLSTRRWRWKPVCLIPDMKTFL